MIDCNVYTIAADFYKPKQKPKGANYG